MSFFNKRTSTGIFVPDGGGFKEYKGETANRSINEVAGALGYHPDQIYATYHSDPKKQINFIVFEVFSRNIVFLSTDKTVTAVTQKHIKRYLGDFSVVKEYSSIRIISDLTNGIDSGSLTIDFLTKVLKLKNTSRNGMFYSERIKTYLYFTEGLLTDFLLEDGLFPWSKHLQEVNKTVYNWIADLAYKYWPNDSFQAKKEINIQCEAWSSIPEAFGNEFIYLHRTENGGANLHMIRVCHYGYPITISQFKEINHGRYSFVADEVKKNMLILKSGMFLYHFDTETGDLLHSELISN